jgi:hypothetical protein
MFRDFIDWWAGLNAWLRFGVAGIFLLLTPILLLFTTRIWIGSLALGLALLIFSFPSSNERKGYHDL